MNFHNARDQRLQCTPLECIAVRRPVDRVEFIANACIGRRVLDWGAMDVLGAVLCLIQLPDPQATGSVVRRTPANSCELLPRRLCRRLSMTEDFLGRCWNMTPDGYRP